MSCIISMFLTVGSTFQVFVYQIGRRSLITSHRRQHLLLPSHIPTYLPTHLIICTVTLVLHCSSTSLVPKWHNIPKTRPNLAQPRRLFPGTHLYHDKPTNIHPPHHPQANYHTCSTTHRIHASPSQKETATGHTPPPAHIPRHVLSNCR